jgi:phage FluMu protein Com
MIKFRCKNCNQKIGVRDELSGKRVKCPKCKNIIIIPKVENVPLATSQNTSSDLKTDAKTSEFDLSLLDVPQDVRSPSQATARESASDQTSEDTSEAEEETASEAGQAVGERKLPWFIDIFLYPISAPGLITLAIIILLPLLIDIVSELLGPFGFFISIPGFFFIKIPIGLYLRH